MYLFKKCSKKVFKICSSAGDFMFLEYFLDLVARKLQAGTCELGDYRERNDNDGFERRYFHCHKKSYNCRLSSNAQAEL